MKKSIDILTICLLMLFGTAEANDKGNDKPLLPVKSKYDNVKVYKQAGTAAEILAILDQDETVWYIRPSNMNGGGWSIVYTNGIAGYVLTNEIYSDAPYMVRYKKKKSKKVKADMLTEAKK